jgi:hypothetical protein
VFAVEPVGDFSGDEELGACPKKSTCQSREGSGGVKNYMGKLTIGVGTSVGHTQETLLGMLDAEVLILEFLAVDGFAAGAIALGEVSTLDHESGDDAVEAGALIAKAMLTGGQLIEVSGCVWDLLAVKTDDDAAEVLFVLLDVEVDLLGDCGVSHLDGLSEVKLGVV